MSTVDRDGCPVELQTLTVYRVDIDKKIEEQGRYGWKLYDFALMNSPYQILLIFWKLKEPE